VRRSNPWVYALCPWIWDSSVLVYVYISYEVGLFESNVAVVLMLEVSSDGFENWKYLPIWYTEITGNS